MYAQLMVTWSFKFKGNILSAEACSREESHSRLEAKKRKHMRGPKHNMAAVLNLWGTTPLENLYLQRYLLYNS